MEYGKKIQSPNNYLINAAMQELCLNRFSCCHARYQQQWLRLAYYRMMIGQRIMI